MLVSVTPFSAFLSCLLVERLCREFCGVYYKKLEKSNIEFLFMEVFCILGRKIRKAYNREFRGLDI